MNRATRRAEERRARRELVEMGCRCRPSIADAPVEQTNAVGAVAGWHIHHDLGCPFGDTMLPLNRLGLLPAIFVNGLSRCQR